MKNADDWENRLLTRRRANASWPSPHARMHARTCVARPNSRRRQSSARSARSAAVASRFVRANAAAAAAAIATRSQASRLAVLPTILPPQVYYCCSLSTPLSTKKKNTTTPIPILLLLFIIIIITSTSHSMQVCPSVSLTLSLSFRLFFSFSHPSNVLFSDGGGSITDKVYIIIII